MAEYDELGAEEFLARYGSHPHGVSGCRARAAVRLQSDRRCRPRVRDRQFLTASDFSGGQQTVVKTLEALGFSFAPPPPTTPAPGW